MERREHGAQPLLLGRAPGLARRALQLVLHQPLAHVLHRPERGAKGGVLRRARRACCGCRGARRGSPAHGAPCRGARRARGGRRGCRARGGAQVVRPRARHRVSRLDQDAFRQEHRHRQGGHGVQRLARLQQPRQPQSARIGLEEPQVRNLGRRHGDGHGGRQAGVSHAARHDIQKHRVLPQRGRGACGGRGRQRNGQQGGARVASAFGRCAAGGGGEAQGGTRRAHKAEERRDVCALGRIRKGRQSGDVGCKLVQVCVVQALKGGALVPRREALHRSGPHARGGSGAPLWLARAVPHQHHQIHFHVAAGRDQRLHPHQLQRPGRARLDVDLRPREPLPQPHLHARPLVQKLRRAARHHHCAGGAHAAEDGAAARDGKGGAGVARPARALETFDGARLPAPGCLDPPKLWRARAQAQRNPRVPRERFLVQHGEARRAR
mmetsp:Transcript_24548/g.80136  ORF Transcript_24548/g.80136 Transcript_24548/m.80136 type:complete len:438 (-) Transcript_24548:1856-3169(-)